MFENRKMLIALLSIVLALSLAPSMCGASLPDPIIDLGFNEGTGTTTANSGSAGGEFTLTTPMPIWSENVPSGGGTSSVDFGTTANGYYAESTDVISELAGLDKFTVTLWVNCTDSTTGAGGNRLVCWKVGTTGGGLDLVYLSTGGLHMAVNEWPDWPNNRPTKSSEKMIPTDAAAGADNWRFIALTYDSTLSSDHVTYYFGNANEKAAKDVSCTYPEGGAVGTNIQPLTIGNFAAGDRGLTGRQFRGLIDEVKIYGDVLTLEQIQSVQAGIKKGTASSPVPENDATDISRDVVLSWTPGTVSGKSDVYFGTSFEDANDGAAVSPGQDANSYDPGRLEFDTPYFWRVDDINSADATVTKGTVWVFATEPKSIMIPADQIGVTASSYGGDPNVTIDGTGLNAEGQHGFETPTMWLSGGEANAWLQYSFDKTYKLDVMRVWNHNSQLEGTFGFGAKQVTVSYSADGENWTVLEGVSQFEQATGRADYVANTFVDFAGAAVQHVRIVMNSNWGATLPQTGLSEVQFMAIPEAARSPQPDTGAVDVELEPVLKWRAGRHAAEHVVYLSSDLSAVEDGSAPSETVVINQYAAPGLVLGQTYYWRVDEVNDAEVPAIWEGAIWNFTTEAYVTIDDFESYNDTWGNIVFQSWIDGFGWEDAEGNSQDGNGSGSAVGYWPPPTIEDVNVYDGDQSMPLSYGLDDKTLSETTHTLPKPQPVSKFGITTLSLQFYGSAANVPGQLFVKINGQKVSDYPGSQDDMKLPEWHSWTIDMAGITSITSMTIGVTGGSGTIFIDAIRLD